MLDGRSCRCRLVGASISIACLLGAVPALGEADRAEAEPPKADIVVVAVAGKCRVKRAGMLVNNRDLAKLGSGWPKDRPLRVEEPRGADRKCLTRIVLDLEKKGFRSFVFVDPAPRN
ncbi:hypothetical protein [Novosphingobium aquimarinum]|uniref:hypothetical protein n=1 Tax=Novosphingobium aquimarinum TaxID=2682494 RepID=UPI0012EC9CC0|nr:hypothetical protein [Novosphingobium aquimarinum]